METTPSLQGCVKVRCDLGVKFLTRYLILRGSSLWISKQPVKVEGKTHASLLTGREEYFMIRLDLSGDFTCSMSPDATGLLLEGAGTSVRSSSSTTFILFFGLADNVGRKKWKKGLEEGHKHLTLQHKSGNYKKLVDIAARMHNSIPIADRFYHLIRYRKCFLGSEAASWLVQDQKCSLDMAIAIGNEMVDLNIFHHVTYEHFLCDAYLFYRFNMEIITESEFFGDEGGSSQLSANNASIGSEDETSKESPLPLLHAIEDLEAENRSLRLQILENTEAFEREREMLVNERNMVITRMKKIESVIIQCYRIVIVVVVYIALNPLISFVVGPLTGWSTWLFFLHLLVVEYIFGEISQFMHRMFSQMIKYIGVDITWLGLPLAEDDIRFEQANKKISAELKSEIEELNPSNCLRHASRESDGTTVQCDEDNASEASLSDHAESNAENVTLRLPPFSHWPNYPLLVRRSPRMFQRPSSTAPHDQEGSMDAKDEKESIEQLIEPLRIHQEPPHSAVFAVDNHLFQGKVFVVVAGVQDSPVEFFKNKNRLFEVVVQGRFKQRTPFCHVYNGQLFYKPFDNLPPKWMLRILIKLLSKIQPGLQVSMSGKNPYIVSSLIAASKHVVVSIPGSEPDICITRANEFEALREDMTLLASTASACDDTARNVFNSRSSSRRAQYFSKLENLSKFSYSPDHVYTFDFYQHVLNIGQMSLDLGFTSLDVSKIIGFSPVQIMAVKWDPNSEPDMENIEYFYNIEMWNRKCIPSDFFDVK